jgi:DHA1 family tetracycline resistance protein-like MFS transporter
MKTDKTNFYILASLFMIIFIDALGISLVYPIFAPLFNIKTGGILPATISLTMRDFLYGLTLGIYPILMFFGAPILGDLSDHIGRKKVLLICLYSESACMCISALAITMNNILLLILGRAFAGFVAGSLSTVQASIVDISYESNKTVNLGLISFASASGFIIGPLMSSILADKSLVSWFSYTTPFIAASILAFLNGTTLIFIFKETFYPKAKLKIHLTKGLEVFISAFTNRKIRTFATIYLLLTLSWIIYFQFINLYLVQVFAYNLRQISHYITWIAILLGFSYLVILRIVVRFFKLTQIISGALACAIIGTTIAMWKIELIQWLAVIPIVIGRALSYAVSLTIFSNSVDKDSQGWVMGVAGAITAASSGTGAILAGILGAFSVEAPFVIATILLILALAATATLFRKNSLV